MPSSQLAQRPQNGSAPMPQSLAIARREPAPLSLETLGAIFAKSGFFQDAKSEAQAIVKILYGQELGIGPTVAMLSVHIINGKPCPSAGLLAGLIKSSGKYTFRVTEMTDQAVTLAFRERNGNAWEDAGVSRFTLAEAAQAGVSDGPNKANWKKFPRNMLFARALSNGARWFCSDVFGGPVYVAEEMGATVDAEGNVRTVTYDDVYPKEDGPPPTLCADCQQPIGEFRGISVAGVVARSTEKYGVALCGPCATARNQAAPAPAATTPPETVVVDGRTTDTDSGEVLAEQDAEGAEAPEDPNDWEGEPTPLDDVLPSGDDPQAENNRLYHACLDMGLKVKPTRTGSTAADLAQANLAYQEAIAAENRRRDEQLAATQEVF